MKIKIIIYIALVAALLLIATKLALAYNGVLAEKRSVELQEALQREINSMSTIDLVNYIAPQYGQNPELIKKIINCESGSNPNTIHDGGYGKGSTGFHVRTFNDWKVKFNHKDYNYDSNYDQIALMSEVFSKGEEYRNAWTTYVAYKNGGTYSFYSKLLKKDFTVVCK